MSQTIEQAEELRSKAISILLAERQQIDDTLASLSYGAQPQPKKSYRKRRTPEESGADAIPSQTQA
jgi:hypothetical protein